MVPPAGPCKIHEEKKAHYQTSYIYFVYRLYSSYEFVSKESSIKTELTV